MQLKDRLDQPWGHSPTVDPEEIARFDALADEWWNPKGKFRMVHAFNEVRCDFIVDRVAHHFHRNKQSGGCLSGLDMLDVGCGDGLVSERLAEVEANVVGIDATARNIEIARRHALKSGLIIDYRYGLTEHVAAGDEYFDVVLNLEVIEHVADPARLMVECSALVRPGGLLIVATINRTLRSWVKAIVGAEYVLRWLPVGTHDWWRFLRPEDIQRMVAPHGLNTREVSGITFNPLNNRWRVGADTSVNYMLIATRP